MPTLTNYERELEASAEKAKRDVETRPIKAIKSAATIQAEAIVGLQAADEALFTARRKAEAAINAEQGASKRIKALEELMASVQLKLGKAEQLPHGKQDDHVEVTKNFAIKEDLEARREDLAMRLEMSKFDYDVRRVQLKKAKACVSLAKRMVDEMSTSSKLIHTKTEDQLHRIREGAEASYAPVRVAEVALRLSAKAMLQKLQGVITDSEQLIAHTKEHQFAAKENAAAQTRDIDFNMSENETFTEASQKDKLNVAQREQLLNEYKKLEANVMEEKINFCITLTR